MQRSLDVVLNMPKLMVILVAGGPASFLLGLQGSKLMTNYTAGNDGLADSKAARNAGIIDRLMPTCAHFNPKHIEKLMKKNSALQSDAKRLEQKISQNIPPSVANT